MSQDSQEDTYGSGGDTDPVYSSDEDVIEPTQPDKSYKKSVMSKPTGNGAKRTLDETSSEHKPNGLPANPKGKKN